MTEQDEKTECEGCTRRTVIDDRCGWVMDAEGGYLCPECSGAEDGRTATASPTATDHPNPEEKRMTDTTHRCPSPGCPARVVRAKFACLEHWRALPASMQEDIIRGHRDRRRDDGRDHMRAMVAAQRWLRDAAAVEPNT